MAALMTRITTRPGEVGFPRGEDEEEFSEESDGQGNADEAEAADGHGQAQEGVFAAEAGEVVEGFGAGGGLVGSAGEENQHAEGGDVHQAVGGEIEQDPLEGGI